MAAGYGHHPGCPMAASFSLPCRQGSIGEGPTMRPGEAEPTVVVIDDDEEIREGLQGLFGSVGLRAWRCVCPRSASWPGRISLASSLSSARSPTILTHRRDRMDIARP